jgi:ABC-2 type transport system permease protein
MQSIASPVLSTSLYFIVFGAAIGSRMGEVDGVPYGAFIIPGLVMLSLLSESIQRVLRHLHAQVVGHHLRTALRAGLLRGGRVRLRGRRRHQVLSWWARSSWSRRGSSWTTRLQHPVWMLGFLVLTSVTFSLFGFFIGLWADSFQKLQVIPLLVITPLTFLGGSFYSIDMLPPCGRRSRS